MLDKDHRGFINCFKDLVTSITLIDIPNQKVSISKEEFKNKLNDLNQDIKTSESIIKSIEGLNKNSGDVILITGSLYLAGEVLNLN